MTEEYWYQEGLRFTCIGCGQCCRGPGGFVWLTVEEMEQIAARLEMPFKQFTRRYIREVNKKYALIDGPTGDCVFLSAEGRCEIYDLRPEQCRTFPWWPENLVSREEWEENYNDCPGINQGELHSVEEIRQKAGLDYPKLS